MRKGIALVFLFLLYGFVLAQNSEPIQATAGFAFPLGVKVIIRLEPIDSVHFNYSVVKSENMNSVIDSQNTDKFLTKKLDENCLEFLFCIGTHGETDKERRGNYETLLILNNQTPYNLDYKADIQLPNSPDFKPTSVLTLFSHVKSREIWPYRIDMIGLHSFMKKGKD